MVFFALVKKPVGEVGGRAVPPLPALCVPSPSVARLHITAVPIFPGHLGRDGPDVTGRVP